MVSRRSTLALLISGISIPISGCLNQRGTSTQRTPTSEVTATDTGTTRGLNTPPEGWPPDTWTPEWTHSVPVTTVIDFDDVDGQLLITAYENRGDTIIQSYDPETRSVRWECELSGEAVENSPLGSQHGNRNRGVYNAGETLLTVTGRKDQGWTRLHAIDPETGDVRWSFRLDRIIGLQGLADSTLFLIARDFREGTPTPHHHGSDTPSPEPVEASLLAVDITDGSTQWRQGFTGVGAVAADGEMVYVAEMNRLLGFTQEGDRKWTVHGDARGTAIFPSQEIIYYIIKPGWDTMVIRGVDREGTVRWVRQFNTDEAVLHRDRLYVANERLFKLGSDGTTIWQSQGPASRMTFGPDNDRLYIRTGRQGNEVAAVSVADGRRQWTYKPPIRNAWPEVAGYGTVVVGAIGQTDTGKVGQPLYRVDARTGKATAQYIGEDPISTFPENDYVFVGTKNYDSGGHVLALRQ